MSNSFVVRGIFFTVGFVMPQLMLVAAVRHWPVWVVPVLLLLIFVILVAKSPIAKSFGIGAGSFGICLIAMAAIRLDRITQNLSLEDTRMVMLSGIIIGWVIGMLVYRYNTEKDAL